MSDCRMPDGLVDRVSWIWDWPLFAPAPAHFRSCFITGAHPDVGSALVKAPLGACVEFHVLPLDLLLPIHVSKFEFAEADCWCLDLNMMTKIILVCQLDATRFQCVVITHHLAFYVQQSCNQHHGCNNLRVRCNLWSGNCDQTSWTNTSSIWHLNYKWQRIEHATCKNIPITNLFIFMQYFGFFFTLCPLLLSKQKNLSLKHEGF